MKKQMQRIAVILLAILLMIVYGNKPAKCNNQAGRNSKTDLNYFFF